MEEFWEKVARRAYRQVNADRYGSCLCAIDAYMTGKLPSDFKMRARVAAVSAAGINLTYTGAGGWIPEVRLLWSRFSDDVEAVKNLRTGTMRDLVIVVDVPGSEFDAPMDERYEVARLSFGKGKLSPYAINWFKYFKSLEQSYIRSMDDGIFGDELDSQLFKICDQLGI